MHSTKSTRNSCLAREAAPTGLKALGRHLARVSLEQRVKLAGTGSTRVRVGVCHDHLPCDVRQLGRVDAYLALCGTVIMYDTV